MITQAELEVLVDTAINSKDQEKKDLAQEKLNKIAIDVAVAIGDAIKDIDEEEPELIYNGTLKKDVDKTTANVVCIEDGVVEHYITWDFDNLYNSECTNYIPIKTFVGLANDEEWAKKQVVKDCYEELIDESKSFIKMFKANIEEQKKKLAHFQTVLDSLN